MHVQSPVGNVSAHPSPGAINPNCLRCARKSAIIAPNCGMFLLLMQLSDKQLSLSTIRAATAVFSEDSGPHSEVLLLFKFPFPF